MTTEHGITQDLEALKRVGFGGVVIYEQVFKHAPGALKSLSPEWLARVRFAAGECARLGLSLEVNAGPGYVAGGPWITPELGMQRLVSSELKVQGGQRFSGTLPAPPSRMNFYRDVAVLAYPSPAGGDNLPQPILTSAQAGLDLDTSFDPGASKKISIPPAPNGGSTVIQLDYGKPVTARSFSFSQRPNSKSLILATQIPGNWGDDAHGQNVQPHPPLGQLESSDDGRQWEQVCTLPQLGHQFDGRQRQTLAFPARTARFFRLNLRGWGRNAQYKDDALQLGSVELRSEARIDQWEVKSANHMDFADSDRTPNYNGNEVIDPKKIVNLTSRLRRDGKLEWAVPPGQWTMLRFGHTPVGATTKHGPEGTEGLECDKMSARATRVQFENYVGKILQEVRAVQGARLSGVNLDSAERGPQNWTANFSREFQKRRKYDMLRFLPAMAGRVVGSSKQAEQFLFDVRRTCSDLISDEYYGEFQRLCHANRMTFMAQAPGIATCLPVSNLQAKGRTDIPMGEFWMSQPDGTMDSKEAASAAHVYGLPVAAAEAFTGSKADVTPEKMKPFADAALALGINRFVVLAYVHQPWDDKKPGVTEDRFYLPYQRHNTWWEYSGGFWNTLARSSHMMRQGQPVMDLLYNLGSDIPLKIATARMRPAPPSGYDYDVCGDDVLLQAKVKSGRVVLPGGMSYGVLILAGGERMTLAAARRLRELVRQGAVVLASNKPVGSPSLSDGSAGDAEVRNIADELWGAGQTGPYGERVIGRGKLIWGRSPEEVLRELGLPKDFEVVDAPAQSKILFAHRQTGNEDIYFVANHLGEAVEFTGLFRVQGRVPQLWNPETGELTALSGFRAQGNRVAVPLRLEANTSRFIVFRDGAVPQTVTPVLVGSIPVWKTFSGPWQVGFQPNWGAPEQLTFPELTDWIQHADSGVRHYSGTTTYIHEFELPDLPEGKVILDLGRVAVVASVALNGQECGVLWKAPFAVDVTKALRASKNRLEVKVANVWTNRLIADAGLPEAQRLSWATFNPYKPGDKLLSSGLLGPVQLRAEQKK